MTRVLLTGFGDWAGSRDNPAEAVAEALSGETVAGAAVEHVIAPSVFKEMVPSVTARIDAVSPDVVIMMGEYGGRASLTVERLAQNLIDATRYGFGDETGDEPQDRPVVEGGPAAYYATLPIRAMVRAMRDAGVPADISDTAATFGCNLLMYGVLHHVATNGRPIRAGWVHLPSLPKTAALEKNLGMPSMSLATQVEGVRAGIAAAVTHAEDIAEPIRSRWQL
ncbi:MAG: pyroglutamyl-peptidase I [Planctomycetota bacterium]